MNKLILIALFSLTIGQFSKIKTIYDNPTVSIEETIDLYKDNFNLVIKALNNGRIKTNYAKEILDCIKDHSKNILEGDITQSQKASTNALITKISNLLLIQPVN